MNAGFVPSVAPQNTHMFIEDEDDKKSIEKDDDEEVIVGSSRPILGYSRLYYSYSDHPRISGVICRTSRPPPDPSFRDNLTLFGERIFKNGIPIA